MCLGRLAGGQRVGDDDDDDVDDDDDDDDGKILWPLSSSWSTTERGTKSLAGWNTCSD